MEMSKDGELDWLKAPHTHRWYLGPLTDKLMRHRPAICTGCWEITTLRAREWHLAGGEEMWPVWGRAEAEQYRDEIERRFFS